VVLVRCRRLQDLLVPTTEDVVGRTLYYNVGFLKFFLNVLGVINQWLEDVTVLKDWRVC